MALTPPNAAPRGRESALDYAEANIALRRLKEARERVAAAEEPLRTALAMTGFERGTLDHLLATKKGLVELQDALETEMAEMTERGEGA